MAPEDTKRSDSQSGGLRERLEALHGISGRESRRTLAQLDLRGADLKGAGLSGLDLSGLDLSHANLANADLSGANFSRSRLTGASLYEAELREAEFVGASLRDCDFRGCRGSLAGFGGADLQGARMFEAELRGSTFSHARLDQADLRCADLREARIHEAGFADVDLSKADLRGAELSGSSVSGTSFDGVDFRGTRLRALRDCEKASWIDVDIRDTDFRGAYALRRLIVDENYLHEFRSRGRVARLIYWVWWLTSDCGRSFARWGAWTALVVVGFAGLFSAVEIDYGSYSTFLSPLYYSVITVTTLGYGDVLPASIPAQLLAMTEVTVGYVALGGLISILANKMARRGE